MTFFLSGFSGDPALISALSERFRSSLPLRLPALHNFLKNVTNLRLASPTSAPIPLSRRPSFSAGPDHAALPRGIEHRTGHLFGGAGGGDAGEPGAETWQPALCGSRGRQPGTAQTWVCGPAGREGRGREFARRGNPRARPRPARTAQPVEG